MFKMVSRNWILYISIQVIFILYNTRGNNIDLGCVRLSKSLANKFLSFPEECCMENGCEQRMNMPSHPCHKEKLREYIVTTAALEKGFKCPPGNDIQVTSWCVGHYMFSCTDVCDSLGVPRCQNGGTCKESNSPGIWLCDCVPGFTGLSCESEIDECESQPCQNGGTCYNMINSFKCICPPKFYGDLCDTNICHPTPADVVFVLDSSVSMTQENFRQQIAFVCNFTDHVSIGPHDFQISVITFSTEARVEFFLNDHPNITDLKFALDKITFKTGATFTDKGLQLVKTVFRAGFGIERRFHGKSAERFVYLLTDGMSNERTKTLQAASDLKDYYDVTIAVIGIGLQVSHPELLGVASRPDLVFSLSNFNSLHTLLKELVQHTCSECIQSSRSDISIIVDVTNATATDDFMAFISSVRSLAKVIDLTGETRISVSTFDDSLEEFIAFDSAPTADDVILATTFFNRTHINSRMNITAAILAAAEQLAGAAGPDAKRFIITMTTGNFSQSPTDSDSVGFVPPAVIKNGIEIIAMANRNGQHNNITNLFQLATDPFNVFLVDPNAMDDMNVLTSSFTYNNCNLTEE